MKKNLFWMAGLVMAAGVGIGVSRLGAEDNKKESTPPRTRIALLNLTYVIKNYDKYKEFEIEMKRIVEPYQKRDAELRTQLKELREQAENPSLVPAKGEDLDEKDKKEEIEDKGKRIKRDIEENAAKIKSKLGKKSDEEMKTLYQDVSEAVQRYAVAHGLDLVLHYNDAITQEDLMTAKNIARKLNTGALMPMYSKPSMDISQDLVAILNRDMHKN